MPSDQPNDDKKNEEKHPEAFPENKLMPGGWDLTDMVSKAGGSPEKDQEAKEKDKKDPAKFDREKMKFPEPQTYPKDWKISD